MALELLSGYLLVGGLVGLLFHHHVDMPVGQLALVVAAWPLWVYVTVRCMIARRRLVEVSLELLESGRRVIRVNVRWKKDPRHASHIDIAPESLGSAEAVRQKVLLCAGALSEMHCDKYQDTLLPDDAVRMAADALRECLMNEAQRTKRLQ